MRTLLPLLVALFLVFLVVPAGVAHAGEPAWSETNFPSGGLGDDALDPGGQYEVDRTWPDSMSLGDMNVCPLHNVIVWEGNGEWVWTGGFYELSGNNLFLFIEIDEEGNIWWAKYSPSGLMAKGRLRKVN